MEEVPHLPDRLNGCSGRVLTKITDPVTLQTPILKGGLLALSGSTAAVTRYRPPELGRPQTQLRPLAGEVSHRGDRPLVTALAEGIAVRLQRV